MIKCLRTAFCENYKIKDDGLASLESIFADVSRSEMPAKINLCFASYLELAINEENMDKDFELHVIIKSPMEEPIDDYRQQIIFQQYTEATARCLIVIKYGEFSFTEFGKYSFEVYVNDEYVYTSLLNVNQEINK